MSYGSLVKENRIENSSKILNKCKPQKGTLQSHIHKPVLIYFSKKKNNLTLKLCLKSYILLGEHPLLCMI